MGEVKINAINTEFKPTSTLDLRGKIGNYVLGTLKKQIKDDYFGNPQVILTVDDMEGSTTLYDKEKKEKVEVRINPGDDVFFILSAVALKSLKDLEEGTKVRIVFKGQGKAKKQGQKGAYKYDIFKVEA